MTGHSLFCSTYQFHVSAGVNQSSSSCHDFMVFACFGHLHLSIYLSIYLYIYMCVCVWSVLLNAWCSSFSFAHNGSFLMWQRIVCMFEILSQRLRVSAHHQNQNCCCQASWLHLCIARRGYRSSNSETSKQKRSMLLYSFGKACGMFLDGISWMHCKVCECGVTKNVDKKIST